VRAASKVAKDTTVETEAVTEAAAVEAGIRLTELANGLRVSQALFVAAELQIADFLSRQALTGAELAACTKTDVAALGRIMRALCSLGIFSQEASGHFALTPVGVLLRSDLPQSFRAGAQFMTGPVRWRCWSDLLETIRTGKNRPESLFGMQLFNFYAAHPVESKVHDDAMRSFSATHTTALLNAIELKDARCVIDVGGGTGELLAAVLKKHSFLRGVLFDLPNVVEHAPSVLAAAGVLDRCTVEGGSFFEKVPARGDVYLLKQVIHDWNDQCASAILRCCYSHVSKDARLLVIERRMPERPDPGAATEVFLADLEMLVMTPGGRERTEAEFKGLFAEVGLEHLKTLQTASPLSIFETRPRRSEH
jgi:hypothetical protein